jgi:hypothetical protein
MGLGFLKVEKLLPFNSGKCDKVTGLSRPKHWNEHATTHIEVYIFASTPHMSWWMMGFSLGQMNKSQGPKVPTLEESLSITTGRCDLAIATRSRKMHKNLFVVVHLEVLDND